jgi:uncharacterized membrane protein HdeD (DUF308 family)
MFAQMTSRWWSVALRGVATVVFGLLALAWPGITLGALVIVVGAYALVDGIFNAVAAVGATQDDGRWWALLLESLLSVGFGVVALVWTGLTALARISLIAARSLVTGFLEIAAAIRSRQEIEGEWLLALGGVASVAFGRFAMVFPGDGAFALIWLIGTYAVFFGMLLIALSFRLRAHHDRDPLAGGQLAWAMPAGSH